MKPPSEEVLNAYADGALDDRQRAEVEAYIETDAAARALVEALRTANALAREAFDDPMHEQAPPALIATILQARPNKRGSVLAAAARTARAGARSLGDYTLPMAAAIALAVGIAGGVLFSRGPSTNSDALVLGAVPSDTELHRLLEAIPSGQLVEIAGSRGIAQRYMVVATIKDRHARACREVEALAPGAGQTPLIAGVACRTPGGGWVVEGAVKLAAPAAGSQHFEPSGVSKRDALEGLLALLGAQKALTSEEERALMGRQWK